MKAEQEKRLEMILAACVKRGARRLELNRHALGFALGGPGVDVLCRWLKKLGPVTELDLNGSEIGPHGIRALADHTAWLAGATVLEINGSSLGAAGLAELGRLIGQLPRLRSLRMRESGLVLDMEAAEAWAQGLAKVSDLSLLDLGGNELDDQDMTRFWYQVARRMPVLKQLLLSENAFGPSGAGCIARCAAGWPLLEQLDLSMNSLFSEGATVLSEPEWPSLRDLDLAICDITSAGARALAEGAGRMPRLERLNVVGCAIEDDGMRALIASLRREPWRSSMKTFIARQNDTALVPDEVASSSDPSTWRQFGGSLPPTVHELKVIAGGRGRGKRLTADAAKSILALLDTCLDWPGDLISERQLHSSALLADKRRALGLDARVSQTTIHNHLGYLARACGLPGVLELREKKQSSRLRAGAKEKLALLRSDLLTRIKRDEERG